MAELELAHADAHPQDVQMRGELRYREEGRHGRWVVLTMDATLRVAKEAARKWVLERRKSLAGMSVVSAEASP